MTKNAPPPARPAPQLRLLRGALAALLWAALCVTAQGRVFTDKNGRLVEGEVLALEGNSVTFKRVEDGRVFRFRLDILADSDQEFIRQNYGEGSPSADRRLSRTEVLDHAARIDRVIHQALRVAGQAPNPPANDAIFMRRAYLDIVGRNPTYDEARAFLEGDARNKRAALVDLLIDSEGYISHNFNYWADVLRVQSRVRGMQGGGGAPYIGWLKDSLRANKPYDQMVHELVAAEGNYWERGNGAVGYYFRDRGMPLDNLANTARIFLGTRMECAQCHDHPFDRWTQMDFFQLAAFTDGLGRMQDVAMAKKLSEFQRHFRKDGGEDRVTRDVTRLIADALRHGIPHKGSGTIRLPNDYQYDDANPRELVQAKVPFGQPVKLDHPASSSARGRSKERDRDKARQRAQQRRGSPDVGSRVAFADWMTSAQNPRFTTVITNRLWKRAFKRALVEPLDDMREDSAPSIPELQEVLNDIMVDLDYDLRAFQRVIFNTKAYGRRAAREDVPVEGYLFPGPVMTRVTGEQMWDSLLALTLPEVDRVKNPFETEPVGYALHEKYKDMSAAELIAEAERLIAKVNRQKGQKNRGAIYRMLGQENEDAMRPTMTAYEEAGLELEAKMRAARSRKDFKRFKALQAEYNEKGYNKRVRLNRNFVRASELGSPAPAGHFVREFGASDREQIENGDKSAAVTQVLSLLNGFVEETLLRNRRSVLLENVAAADTPEAKIETIFLSILGRTPDPVESDAFVQQAAEVGDEVYHDLIWALVNTREFMFPL